LAKGYEVHGIKRRASVANHIPVGVDAWLQSEMDCSRPTTRSTPT
jgi:hypothetical protein